jgi:hypothetical protein
VVGTTCSVFQVLFHCWPVMWKGSPPSPMWLWTLFLSLYRLWDQKAESTTAAELKGFHGCFFFLCHLLDTPAYLHLPDAKIMCLGHTNMCKVIGTTGNISHKRYSRSGVCVLVLLTRVKHPSASATDRNREKLGRDYFHLFCERWSFVSINEEQRPHWQTNRKTNSVQFK